MSENKSRNFTSKGVDFRFRKRDKKRLSKKREGVDSGSMRRNVKAMGSEVREFRDFALKILDHKVEGGRLLMEFESSYKEASKAVKNYTERKVIDTLYNGIFMESWWLEGNRKIKRKSKRFNIIPLLRILYKNRGSLSLEDAWIEYTKLTGKKRPQDFREIRKELLMKRFTKEDEIKPKPKDKKRHQGRLGKRIILTEKGRAFIKNLPEQYTGETIINKNSGPLDYI